MEEINEKMDKLKVEIFDLQVEFARIKQSIHQKIEELNKLNERNAKGVLSKNAPEEKINTDSR